MEPEEIEGEMYNIERRRKYRWKFEQVLRIYSVLGVLVAIFAGGYFVLTLLPYELTTNQLISLVVSGTGIAVAIMSRALIVYRREQLSQEMEAEEEYRGMAELLNMWRKLEEVGKNELSENDSDVSRSSIRAIFSRLNEEGKLSNSDLAAVEEALRLRNEVVHGEKDISPKEANEISQIISDIIRKIKSE